MNDEHKAISDCQEGKKESFRVLVEKYKVRAYYAALVYTGNQEEALDISQEAFYRAYKSINKFKPGKNFYTWLYQIIRNLCINHYHRKKKRNVVFSDIEDTKNNEIFISPAEKPDEIFEEHELRDVLWNALYQLKEEDREIIILKEYQDLSYKEIADTLQIPVGSVMSRLYYARQKLAKLLEGII